MKNPFKVGDRVACYWSDGASYKLVGTIKDINEAGMVEIVVEKDDSGNFAVGKSSRGWHPKQCRRLIPKKPRPGDEIWVSTYFGEGADGGSWFWAKNYPSDGWIKYKRYM